MTRLTTPTWVEYQENRLNFVRACNTIGFVFSVPELNLVDCCGLWNQPSSRTRGSRDPAGYFPIPELQYWYSKVRDPELLSTYTKGLLKKIRQDQTMSYVGLCYTPSTRLLLLRKPLLLSHFISHQIILFNVELPRLYASLL